MIQSWLYHLLLAIFAPSLVLSTADTLSFLEQLLQKVAGVYDDHKRSPKLDRSVVMVAINHGYLNHLHNFDCFARRLGMKYIVMALDDRLYQALTTINHRLETTNMSSIVIYNFQHLLTSSHKHHNKAHTVFNKHNHTVLGDSASFLSEQFNLISIRKMQAVYSAMLLGYHVLFTDVDITILQDPFPYLLWQNVDYIHSLNSPCTVVQDWRYFLQYHDPHTVEGNTGFYYVRASNASLLLWREFFTAGDDTEFTKFVDARNQGKGGYHLADLDDQTSFWLLLRYNYQVHHRLLRQQQYSASNQTTSTDDVVIVEAMLTACQDMPATSASAVSNSSSAANDSAAVFRLCGLNNCLFSAGMLSGNTDQMNYATLLKNIQLQLQTLQLNQTIQVNQTAVGGGGGAVMIHANWIRENESKVFALKRHGLWLANDDDYHARYQQLVKEQQQEQAATAAAADGHAHEGNGIHSQQQHLHDHAQFHHIHKHSSSLNISMDSNYTYTCRNLS